ncbi:alpha-L-fucosidase [Strongylocentrotus purpuratus]|uniref:alpha-L-fucosidase n=1 Tax=Strongylocentrotus purpuratus TaxID=7668 RepID=A0A7M7RGC4_STRPU|nr:alpha-L-fucosidase [Strongylocentrotus purpuratus]
MDRPKFPPFIGLIPVLLVVFFAVCSSAQYQPNWNSIDSRPLPAWYDQSKFGIFIHWGVFSVPSFDNEWFWWKWKGIKQADVVKFMEDNYRPGFTYPDFAPMFKAEFFDPNQWADIFKASGAKYIVLTSKHHEGFTNWPSKYSWNWNSMDVGPKRDLVGDLAAAIRNKTDIHFGLYHSLFEWFNPLYLQDKANNFTTQEYCEKVLWPELLEIVNAYKPDVIWSDGEWEAPDTYWNSTEFLAWLYNSSPVKDTVVTNDRWGAGIRCHHGGYYTCTDKYNPGVLQKHKWENCMTIDKVSWGYRRNAPLADYLDMDDLIELLASTVSCNGNLLMNIGPTADGRIVPIFEERLRSMGDWLKVNGEAIFETTPWRAQNDTVTKGIWYTNKTTAAYAIVLDWPADNQLVLGVPIPNSQTSLFMLGYNQPLKWSGITSKPGITVTMPQFTPDTLPCEWAWVIQMKMVQ